MADKRSSQTAIESGCQAALMAPTQILAEQHYLTFKKWLEPLGIRLSLRTAAKKEDNTMPLFDGIGLGNKILAATVITATAVTLAVAGESGSGS